tara:strand:- start:337 stop:2028 length:1692 start_codon:yes stop_codon:yes gene_type:complete
MRQALFATMILLVATFSAIPLTLATAPSGDSDETISSATVWDEDGIVNGTLLIESGSSLTINSNISVISGSSIMVEDGASLTLNGNLVGAELDSLIRLQYDSSLLFNLGDVAESGTMRIEFDYQIPSELIFNITVGEEVTNASGEEFVDITVPLNGDDIYVNFSISSFSTTHITSVSFAHSGDTVVTFSPQEMNYDSASLVWLSSSFDLSVLGDFTMDSATLDGADLNCIGECTIANSQLTGSAPINIQNEGSLSISESSISGSRTDEDIIAHDAAALTYTSNTGTGGDTDSWIRLLSERIIQTNSNSVNVYETGIGYGDDSRYDITNESGIVDIGGSEFRRIVEWMDGDGVQHIETGVLTFTITSGWGVFNITIAAPHTPYAEINIPLPYISIDTIDLEKNIANVNESIGFMLTVSNSGAAEATVNIRCYVNGEDVDTAPSTITVTLLPGESKKTPVSWYAYDDGQKILVCKALIPNILGDLSEDITNTEGAISQEVSWVYKETAADAPLLIYGTILVAILGGLWFYTRNTTEHETESESSVEQEKQYVEDIEEIITESDDA